MLLVLDISYFSLCSEFFNQLHKQTFLRKAVCAKFCWYFNYNVQSICCHFCATHISVISCFSLLLPYRKSFRHGRKQLWYKCVVVAKWNSSPDSQGMSYQGSAQLEICKSCQGYLIGILFVNIYSISNRYSSLMVLYIYFFYIDQILCVCH